MAPYSTMMVRVGDIEVAARYASPEEIHFDMPPHAPGDVRVQVSLNGVDFGFSYLELHVHAVPVVHRIWPAAGPAIGGAPDATAIPRQSGSATRKTTTDAGKSNFRFARQSRTDSSCAVAAGGTLARMDFRLDTARLTFVRISDEDYSIMPKLDI